MGQGSLGGRRRDAYTLPRDKPGPTRRTARPDGLWALALFDSKKRLLFLTVPLGDGYHGYKSIWGVCQSPVEYKEGAPPTLSRGHAEKTDSKARCTDGADSYHPHSAVEESEAHRVHPGCTGQARIKTSLA